MVWSSCNLFVYQNRLEPSGDIYDLYKRNWFLWLRVNWLHYEKLLSNSVDPVKKLNGSSASFFISLQVFEKFDHFCQKKIQMIRNHENLFFLHIFKNETYNFIFWLFNAVKRSEKLGMEVLEKENILPIFLPNLSDKLNLIIKQEGVLDWRNFLLEFH